MTRNPRKVVLCLGYASFFVLAQCGEGGFCKLTVTSTGLEPAFDIRLEGAASGEPICDAGILATTQEFSEQLEVYQCRYLGPWGSPGVYSLEVTAPGFKTLVLEHIEVEEIKLGSMCGNPVTHEETLKLEPKTD